MNEDSSAKSVSVTGIEPARGSQSSAADLYTESSFDNMSPFDTDADIAALEPVSECTSSNNKSKPRGVKTSSGYYQQQYRSAWEQVPEFKGWLSSVESNPAKAKCLYCNATLAAHNVSLMKHVASSKHQKNAEKVYIMNSDLYIPRSRSIEKPTEDAVPSQNVDIEQDPDTPTLSVTSDNNIQNSGNVELILAETDENDIVTLHDLDDEVDEEEKHVVQVVKFSKEKSPTTSSIPGGLISTHVIDSHAGLPVSNLEITLYKLVNGRWRFVSETITNAGGRASDFVPDIETFQCGKYKLHYHVFNYYEMRKVATVFPYIEVAFDVRSLSDHLHFPLIISANGYNVYKGCAL
ncbi:hypothetical protein M8J77_024092 [Diaphorina citri]|nr:hypothetical protein M8J77_024092 [Diaphorina citri]